MAEYMKQWLGNIKGPPGDKGETGSHLIPCSTYPRTYNTEELNALEETTFDKVKLGDKANPKDFICIPIVVSDRGDSGGYILFQLEQAALPGLPINVAGRAIGYAHGGKGDAAGINNVTATVDEIPLAVPTVEVHQSGHYDAIDLDFDFKGLKGQPAGFGIIEATMDEIPDHHPTVTATWEGPNEAKNLTFDFKGIKGQPAGFGEITATADDKHLDEPTVIVSTSGTNEEMNIDFAFSGLMGYTGPTGAQIIASTCDPRKMTTTELDAEITEWENVTTKAREGDFVCLPVVVTDRNESRGYVLFQVSVNDQEQHKITGEKFAYTYGGKGDAAGFGTVTATADGQHLDEPTVEVRQSGPHTARNFEFDFKGLTGKPAGFGTISAEVEDNVPGVPQVEATMEGPETAKNLSFTFKEIKGERGGLTYKPLSTVTSTTIDAISLGEDTVYDYIYYLDDSYQGSDPLLTGKKSAILFLFKLNTESNFCFEMLYTDSGTGEADSASEVALYTRAIAKKDVGGSITRDWIQVFPLKEITTADVDRMIANTYEPETNGLSMKFVEANEFNYFIQEIQKV